jgi:hypothetical protein
MIMTPKKYDYIKFTKASRKNFLFIVLDPTELQVHTDHKGVTYRRLKGVFYAPDIKNIKNVEEALKNTVGGPSGWFVDYSEIFMPKEEALKVLFKDVTDLNKQKEMCDEKVNNILTGIDTITRLQKENK